MTIKVAIAAAAAAAAAATGELGVDVELLIIDGDDRTTDAGSLCCHTK